MFDSITILAPGLLGGSVAKAVRSRGVARTIRVWSRRVETRASLHGVDWCDEIHDTAMAATAGSDMIVICAPVDRIVALADEIKTGLKPGALVTDVGSVKGEICRLATAALRGHANFVGSHPMAGSDRAGHENAEADLFKGRPCFVTPLEETDSQAIDQVIRFWRALDAHVVTEKPEKHDEIVANISHLPHAVAFTICSLLAQRDMSWRDIAGTGLRDTTRVGGSDAGLWTSIFEQNRDEVLRALGSFEDEFAALRAALANKDSRALRTILERGHDYRAGLRA